MDRRSPAHAPLPAPFLAPILATVLALLLANAPLAVPPLRAQDAPLAGPDSGASLIEKGARLMLEGLLRDMEPAMGELGRALTGMEAGIAPAMAELARLLGDMSAYRMPEVLPNGDILIRRRADAPPRPPQAAPDEGDGDGNDRRPRQPPVQSPEPSPPAVLEL